MKTLGIIGVGNIASAILSGVIKSGYITPQNIFIYDPDTTKTQTFSTEYSVKVCVSAEDVVKSVDYVLIAVKPAVVDTVLKTVSNAINNQCVISVAAGISLSFIAERLPKNTSIMRVMPNTPLMYGNGAVGYSVNNYVTEEQNEFVKGIFSSCGLAVQLEESLLNSVTAVSGSSPAFVFRFIKDIVEEGVKQGLPQNVAEDLVIQTVIGSAIMLKESDKTADELIRMVASPNGTTEAGLLALDKNNFDNAVKSAIDMAYKRSIELTK